MNRKGTMSLREFSKFWCGEGGTLESAEIEKTATYREKKRKQLISRGFRGDIETELDRLCMIYRNDTLPVLYARAKDYYVSEDREKALEGYLA
jgi:hypothetical protein